MNSEKIQQLQLMEQNSQAFMMQKQQFQQQLVEIESAISELAKSKQSYKIIGSVMISADPKDLAKELIAKKEETELRIKTIESQEEKLKEKAKLLRDEVMKEIK
jgi:prefoldin beta subunit